MGGYKFSRLNVDFSISPKIQMRPQMNTTDAPKCAPFPREKGAQTLSHFFLRPNAPYKCALPSNAPIKCDPKCALPFKMIQNIFKLQRNLWKI
jgi:hypothetical protein